MNNSRAALLRFGLRALTATFFLLAAVLVLSQYRRVADWPATLGTVERLVIAPAGDPDDSRAPGERFQPEVVYRYEVEGEMYQGERIAVFDWIFPNQERAHAYLRRSGVESGERVAVYYNPAAPEEAVLIRAIPWNRLEIQLGVVVLVLLPLGVVLYSLFDLLRGGRSRGQDESRGRFW